MGLETICNRHPKASKHLTTELCRAVKLKNNMENPKLLACPFCGGSGLLFSKGIEGSPSLIWYVQCEDRKCCCEIAGGYSKKAAIARWNQRAGGLQPVTPEIGGNKGVGMSDLLAAWDMAHDALTNVADAAKKLGHEPFAREAETIADSLESRVTALSNIARDKAANDELCHAASLANKQPKGK